MGDGVIVDISEDKVDIDNTSTGAQFKQMWDYAKKYSDSVDTALENLAAVVGTFDPKVTIPDILIPTLDGPSFPEKPIWPPLDLDDGWPESFPLPPEFLPYGNMDFTYVAPTAPAEIDGNFDWTGAECTSDMWTALFNKVHTDILNGGNGLTEAVYSAIIARGQSARQVSNDKTYRSALNSVGSRGFNLASGQVGAIQRDIASDIIFSDKDERNALLIKDFDLATENTRFSVTTGAQLEQLLRATFEAAEQRGLEAAKATKDYLIAVYAENVKAYLAKWEGIKLDLEALKTKIDAITSANDGMVKVFLGEASIYETQIKAITEKNAGLVDARQGEVDTYKAEVEAIFSQYAALVEEMKVKMEGSRLEALKAVEESKIDLEAYVSQSSLAEKVAEGIAGVSAQAFASSVGGIHASISNSYSGSESRSESWGHGESLGESHSFDDTK